LLGMGGRAGGLKQALAKGPLAPEEA